MCIFLLSKLHRNKEEIQRKEAHRQSAKGKKKKKKVLPKSSIPGKELKVKTPEPFCPFKQSLKEDKLQIMYLFHQLKIREKKIYYGLNYLTPMKRLYPKPLNKYEVQHHHVEN